MATVHMATNRHAVSHSTAFALVLATVLASVASVCLAPQPARAETIQLAANLETPARPAAAVKKMPTRPLQKAKLMPVRATRPSLITLAQRTEQEGACLRAWCGEGFTLILGIGY